MSILLLSGMRKPILAFVFRKKYCKVSIYANISKNNSMDIAVELRLTLFRLIVFSLLIMLDWFPYGDI